jgi:iron complex outermembrane receptor protein
MLRIVFFPFIFCLLVAQSLAVEIKGEVLNLEGKPVVKAVVLHRQSGNKVLTDENGQFTLSLPEEEKIKLEIIHPDYIEQEIALTSNEFSRKITVRLIPYIMQREEIVVTALRHPESSASVPAAETVIPKETLEEKMPSNITEGLSGIPGVSNLGAGGFSLVPNIRGLTRRRVLIMIDDARVTSDRRTGPNASFVDPNNIERIEVLRSPSSVFYGSDAIGGVIHILTKKSSMQERFKGKINAKYGSVNQERGFGFSLEGSKKNVGFFLSFQGNDAGNYSSPSGEVLQSQFTQASLFAKLSYINAKREVHLSFLGAQGYDIGKANQGSLTSPTWYPKESQNLLQVHWTERGLGREGELSLHAYFNPNFLETIKENKQGSLLAEESYSKTQSLDYGFHLSYGKKIVNYLWLKGGIDFYGRSSVKAYNVDKSFDSEGNITGVFEEWPFADGTRKDVGFFLSFDYSGVKNLDLVSGIRWDSLQMQALPGGTFPSEERNYHTWTGFIGCSVKLSEQVVVFGNLSRAYRAASLNEMFYTGITGRGFIIANPDLNPETSFNLDAGFKLIFKRFFAGIYSFYYEIDDLIERYLINPGERIYAYGNVNRGKISGYELEIEYYPFPGWKIFGNYFSFSGQSKTTHDNLNDIPPSRLFLGTRLWIERFSFEINTTLQQEKKNPGPAEIAIPGFGVVNIKASYLYNSSLSIYLSLSNLLNKDYLARPDPDSVAEPGRNFIFGLSYSF